MTHADLDTLVQTFADALYELLVIAASHIDQIMSSLSTTSPMG
jgi:hypothetical protein